MQIEHKEREAREFVMWKLETLQNFLSCSTTFYESKMDIFWLGGSGGKDLCKNFTSLKIVQSYCFGKCYNNTKKMLEEEEEEL
jgi:hypothetical protein